MKWTQLLSALQRSRQGFLEVNRHVKISLLARIYYLVIMNYLITTFDGFGDGVIYYPVFREVGNKIPKSEFFYTSNLFFQDKVW